LIQSVNYATHHSLRFPRVERVRYDKSYMDIQTNEGLWEHIQQHKGAILGAPLSRLSLSISQLTTSLPPRRPAPRGAPARVCVCMCACVHVHARERPVSFLSIVCGMFMLPLHACPIPALSYLPASLSVPSASTLMSCPSSLSPLAPRYRPCLAIGLFVPFALSRWLSAKRGSGSSHASVWQLGFLL
jgi:hypothetical protein